MGRTSTARQRLVRSGQTLFSSRGYTSVGVSELCEHAGVRKGSFYYFFPSKSDLAVAVVESFWKDFDTDLSSVLTSNGSPLKRLERFLDQIYVHHRDVCASTGFVRGCLLGNLALELSAVDDKVRDKLEGVFGRFAGRLEGTIAEGMDVGELPDGDAELLAEQLVAYIEGMILLSKSQNNAGVLERLRDGVLSLLGAEGRGKVDKKPGKSSTSSKRRKGRTSVSESS